MQRNHRREKEISKGKKTPQPRARANKKIGKGIRMSPRKHKSSVRMDGVTIKEADAKNVFVKRSKPTYKSPRIFL